jgi:ketosteroid isomerase-like protein
MSGKRNVMKLTDSFTFAALLGLVGLSLTGTRALAAGIGEGGADLAKLDAAWSDSSLKRDADLLASFYAEDAAVYPPNDVMFVGRPEAKKYWAAALADSTYTLSWKTVSADSSKGGDLGFTAGTYEESYKGADGKMVKNTGKYVCVWKKDKDGNWKAIHDIWNQDTK